MGKMRDTKIGIALIIIGIVLFVIGAMAGTPFSFIFTFELAGALFSIAGFIQVVLSGTNSIIEEEHKKTREILVKLSDQHKTMIKILGKKPSRKGR